MVIIINPLGGINKIRHGGGLLFNGCFFVMIGYKINVISQSECGAPEEKPVNPPASGVSVLLYLASTKYFGRRNLIRFIDPHRAGGFVVFLQELGWVFIDFEVVISRVAFYCLKTSVCCWRLGRKLWA
jgi:hypothetical protein